MLPIQYKQIKYNTSPRGKVKIQNIIIHYTANYNKGANALMHFNYFNSGDKQSSADFFVDDSNILCINADYKNRYTWAIGDNQYYAITSN